MPNFYHIVVQGRLDAGWSAWFDGLTITNAAHDQTVLAGRLRDQAELHGVLAKIRDLGLPLIAVQLANADLPHELVQRHDDVLSQP